MKICNKCKITKEDEQFRLKKDTNGKYYRYYICKECERIDNKERCKKYRETHKEQIKEFKHDWYEKNKERILEDRKKYRIENKDKINEYWGKNKDKKFLKDKRYREKHKEELKAKHYNKMQNDSVYRFKNTIRNMMRMSFRRKGKIKPKLAKEILGCDIDFFINYLIETYEKRYNEKWKWDYLKNVHIDHKKPLKEAQTIEEIINLCHYTNMQLLKVEENLKKSYKVMEEYL